MLNNITFKNKGWSILLSLLLILTTFLVFPVVTTEGPEWNVTLNFSEPGGEFAYVNFSEATDANDGPPADKYDTALPPPPPSPFIRAWFNDSLPTPYNRLLKDCRKYPDSYKVWNLSVQWLPSDYVSPTTITISWDTDDVNNTEYDSVILYDATGTTPLKEMRNKNSYTFPINPWPNVNFKIIARVFGNNPPIFGDPNPANSTTDQPLAF